MKLSFTELNSGYKGEKRVSRFSEKDKSKMIIAGTLAGVFLFVFILSCVGIIPVGALNTRIKTSFSGDKKRFPIEINSDATLCMDVIDDNIILLTTENVIVYSSHGKVIYSQPHVYAMPGLSVNGDKAVVFDRGGKGFMLLNSKEVVYEGTADNIIITAEYGSNGSYALGTRSDAATSTLAVYDKKHNAEFMWDCAYENIVSIAISDNGKYIGAAVVGAENGELFTTVHYFGIDYNEPLNEQKILGSAPFSLEFTGYNRLTLITGNGVYNITRKGDEYKTAQSYYSSEFSSFDTSSKDNSMVTLAKYGSENVYEILVFSPNGKIKANIPVEIEIKSAYMSNKYIFALAENCIMVYNLRGRNVSEIKFKGEANSLLPTDDFIFVASLDKITRCYSYGNATVEIGS